VIKSETGVLCLLQAFKKGDMKFHAFLALLWWCLICQCVNISNG